MLPRLMLAVGLLLPTLLHAERAPSVLVHCPRQSVDQWRWWVDLTYLGELRAAGFEVDYTDTHSDFTWDRVSRYDVLVIYTVPLERGNYYDNSPNRPPFRDAFIEIVERFLDQGGGVFLMARSLNADESFLQLIERWEARIPYERIEVDDPARIGRMPRMRPSERLFLADDVLDTPVSEGVEQVWLPYTTYRSAAQTMPIEVSSAWQVVLRGGSAARTVPIEARSESMQAPPRARIRPGGVRNPTLFAIRPYRKGRLAFCSVWPQYSIGQGTEWLYERRVLSAGLRERPSHFGRLLENTLAWLAEPRLAISPEPGFVTVPERLVDLNLRPGVKRGFIDRSQAAPPDAGEALRRATSGRLFRGVIGAQTFVGSGSGSVAEYAKAARQAGLDFVVFLDDLSSLEPGQLETLMEQCRKASGKDLQLYAGYRAPTNTGNRMFVFGPGATLPPENLRVGFRINQQYRDPASGAYTRGTPFVDWVNYRLLATKQVNVGYYGFRDQPHAQRLDDLRLFSLAGVRLFHNNVLQEEIVDTYLASGRTTLPAAPVAIHLIDSPAELARAGAGATGLTYAQASSLESLWSALGYATLYEAPNVFTSGGPLVEAWPRAVQFYTFAAEDFVPEAALVLAPVAVSSEAGLREVRIYDGDKLYRRFLLDGDKRFEHVLELSATVQKTLNLVAEDVAGATAVGNAWRCWKGGDLMPLYCGDRINHCDGAPLMAKGPGIIQVARTPRIVGGYTWDGGPSGELPILHLVDAQRPELGSDAGREGQRGFNNRPALVLADAGAVRVSTTLDTLYERDVPPGNPWSTFGPIQGPSRLLASRVVFTELDRRTTGPHPNHHPGFAVKAGPAISLFENHLTFRSGLSVERLVLFRQSPYDGPFPVTLLYGRRGKVVRRYRLEAGKTLDAAPRVKNGEWLAWIGVAPTNTVVQLNRGETLRLRFSEGPRPRAEFEADLSGSKLRAGDTRTYELLSVVEPVDAERRDESRVLEIVDFLTRGPELDLLRGRALGNRNRRNGIVEIEASEGAAALRVERPRTPVGVPLAVRVNGLNPRWSAGLLLKKGHVLGNYGPGENRYREIGLDDAGRAYVPLFPDAAEKTEVAIGHPVVCDNGELFVQVTLRDSKQRPESWHVSLNNPTDQEIVTRCGGFMDLPGLQLAEREVSVPPGGHLVLN